MSFNCVEKHFFTSNVAYDWWECDWNFENHVFSLFSHHCCDNLLTNWNSHVNSSEHGCSIDSIQIFPVSTTMRFIIAEQYCWNKDEQYRWSNNVAHEQHACTHVNNVVQAFPRQQPCSSFWYFYVCGKVRTIVFHYVPSTVCKAKKSNCFSTWFPLSVTHLARTLVANWGICLTISANRPSAPTEARSMSYVKSKRTIQLNLDYTDRETWDQIQRIPTKAPHENKTLFKKIHWFFVPDFLSRLE